MRAAACCTPGRFLVASGARRGERPDRRQPPRLKTPPRANPSRTDTPRCSLSRPAGGAVDLDFPPSAHVRSRRSVRHRPPCAWRTTGGRTTQSPVGAQRVGPGLKRVGGRAKPAQRPRRGTRRAHEHGSSATSSPSPDVLRLSMSLSRRLHYAHRMPSPEPEPEPRKPTGRGARGAALRGDLPSAAGVGAIMGFLAQHEGSGIGVAVVVGVVGCGVVLGMLALKRIFRDG